MLICRLGTRFTPIGLVLLYLSMSLSCMSSQMWSLVRDRAVAIGWRSCPPPELPRALAPLLPPHQLPFRRPQQFSHDLFMFTFRKWEQIAEELAPCLHIIVDSVLDCVFCMARPICSMILYTACSICLMVPAGTPSFVVVSSVICTSLMRFAKSSMLTWTLP